MTYDNSPAAQEIREANRKLLVKYFAEGRTPDMYDDDATMAQPFFFPGQISRIKGPKDGEPMPKMEEGAEKPPEFTLDWVWSGYEIHGTDDPNFFYVENEGSGKQLRGDGKYYDYHNAYVHTFRFKDGKIIEYREIANPVNLMDAMGVHHDSLPTPKDTMEELMALHKK